MLVWIRPTTHSVPWAVSYGWLKKIKSTTKRMPCLESFVKSLTLSVAIGVKVLFLAFLCGHFAAADESLPILGRHEKIRFCWGQHGHFKQAGISTVVFFDAGNAFGDPWGEGHLNVFDLRTAYGFGVRWFSPMGPLRFEWGFPVKPQADERRAVFDFSIGSFF